MNLEEIKKSGLLESYVLGTLSGSQVDQVGQFLKDFPELNTEVREIERVFRAYAEINGIMPRSGLKADIIKEITGKSGPTSKPKDPNTGSGSRSLLIPLLLVSAVALGGLLWGFTKVKKNADLENRLQSISDEYAAYRQTCDSLSGDNAELIAMMNTITNPGNRIIQLTPTGNFTPTTLYLHTNQDLQLNYIQAMTLPSIGANQAFQLWSLKEGLDPIPLSVFSGNEQQIFPIDYEEGTSTYAITIEQAGGASVPNLAQLIGTIKV